MAKPVQDQVDLPFAMTPSERRKFFGKIGGGYAAPPGTGPEGETCGSCVHAWPNTTGSRRTYWKCGLVRSTRGPGTDIRVRSPACREWKPEQ